MKTKLLKLHDAIYDLSKASFVLMVDKEIKIAYGDFKICIEFATEKDALLILEKCYEIMKG